MFGIQEIDSTRLAEMVAANEEDYLLVDVRTHTEMAQGYPVEKPDTVGLAS